MKNIRLEFKMTLKHIYDKMVTDAYMHMDLCAYWHMTPPAKLSGHRLTCNDSTIVEVDMMMDKAMSSKEQDIYLWITLGNKYLEYPLFCDFSKNWCSMMSLAEERGLEVLQEIVDGGKEYLTTQIEDNGITWETALAITEKRMEDILKLPCSCALSVNGQVFHGIEGIEQYTHIQRSVSSPYILKRCHPLPMEGSEDDMLGQRYARNYLLCKNKHEAETFMKVFIGLKDVSALDLDAIPTPADFPPLVCYIDRSRYLLLSYREGDYLL